MPSLLEHMANSYEFKTGNGSNTDFTFSFSYISASDLTVTVDGVVTTAYSLLSTNELRFDTAPASDAVIKIARDSVKDGRKVDYERGSLTEADLDTDSLQGFYAAQEATERADAAMNVDAATNAYDANSKQIKSVAEPTASSDAATKSYVDTKTATAIDSAAAASASASAASDSEDTAVAAAVTASDAKDAAVAAAATLDTTVFIKRDGSQAPTANQDFGSYSLTTTGNVTAATFIGDGSNLTNLPFDPVNDRIARLEANLALNTVRDVVDSGWTLLGMVDGFTDAFVDETGVDTASSVNETYDGTDDFYHGLGAPALDTDGTPSSPYGGVVADAYDNDSGTSATIGTLTDFNTSSSAAKNVFKVDLESVVTVTSVEVNNFRVSSGSYTTGTGIFYSEDDVTYTQLGSNITINTGNQSATRSGPVSARYLYFRMGGGNFSGVNMYLEDMLIYVAQATPNVTLLSEAVTADAVPDYGRGFVIAEPVDSITLNTDLTLEMSRDGGSSWSDLTLELEAVYSGDINIYMSPETDLTGQTSGSSIKLRAKTLNNKHVKLHAWGAQWR